MSDALKCGLDDFFAAGYGRADAEALIVDELPTQDWMHPLSLEDPPAQEFQSHWLPGAAGVIANAVAEATQTPLGLSGVQVLGALSAAVGGKYQIADPWKEPVHAQFIPVMDSGNRKSGAHREVFDPIIRWERSQAADDRKRLREWESRGRVLEAQLKQLENAAANPDGKRAQNMGDLSYNLTAAVEEVEKHQGEKPRITQIIADDVTSERCKMLMFEQGGSLTIASAETAFFGNMGGRYGDGSPMWEVLLHGHAQDMMRTNRVGREGEYIGRPSLTVCVCMQPIVLTELGKRSGFREQGVAARLLPSFPASPLGFRRVITEPVPETAQDDWARTLVRLLELQARRTVDADGVPIPCSLYLAPDAREAFLAYLTLHEPKLRPDGEYAEMTDWGSKLPGQILRIAGLLHVVNHEVPEDAPISLKTVERAIAIGMYFADHARIMFDLLSGSTTNEAARKVLRAIQKLGSPLSRHELHKSLQKQTRFKAGASLDEPLTLLEDFGWIRVERQPTAGRPKQIITLNPYAEKGDKGDKPRSAGVDVHDEGEKREISPQPLRGRNVVDLPAPLAPTGTEDYTDEI